MNTTPKDLFKRYDTPPSRLHDAVQRLARQEGWRPPWAREEQQNQKTAAGKLSARVRRERADLRLALIQIVYKQLKPAYQNQPYSTMSMELIRAEYLKVLHDEDNNLLAVAIRKLLKIEDNDARRRRAEYLSKLLDEGNKEATSKLLEEATSELLKTKACDARSQMLLFCVFLQITLDKLSPNDRKILGQVSEETLKSDFKQLGIRSRHKQKRSG